VCCASSRRTVWRSIGWNDRRSVSAADKRGTSNVYARCASGWTGRD
jgi:hypothetical protein